MVSEYGMLNPEETNRNVVVAAHTVLLPTNDAGDNGAHLNTFVILHVREPYHEQRLSRPGLTTERSFQIVVQSIVWGFIFPIGMVLGLTRRVLTPQGASFVDPPPSWADAFLRVPLVRSKYHVPLQTLGLAMTSIGFFLGHKHSWRHETGVKPTVGLPSRYPTSQLNSDACLIV
jgi:hypothetical protein